MTVPAIEILDLHKSFGDLEVLKGIDFSVAQGDVVAVIGPSGSGKSTLLRCVNLLETPDSGVINIEGFNILDPDCDVDKVRRRIGMVFQQFNHMLKFFLIYFKFRLSIFTTDNFFFHIRH